MASIYTEEELQDLEEAREARKAFIRGALMKGAVPREEMVAPVLKALKDQEAAVNNRVKFRLRNDESDVQAANKQLLIELLRSIRPNDIVRVNDDTVPNNVPELPVDLESDDLVDGEIDIIDLSKSPTEPED